MKHFPPQPSLFLLKNFKRKKATKTLKFSSFLPELMEISLEEMCPMIS